MVYSCWSGIAQFISGVAFQIIEVNETFIAANQLCVGTNIQIDPLLLCTGETVSCLVTKTNIIIFSNLYNQGNPGCKLSFKILVLIVTAAYRKFQQVAK